MVAVFTILWLVTTPGRAFWPIWPLAVLGVVFLVHRWRFSRWAAAPR